MTKPLALIFYERLLPGSQLVNRLQDLGYRVTTVNDLGALTIQAKSEKPMLIVMDLTSDRGDTGEVIRELKGNSETAYMPVLAFASADNRKLLSRGSEGGADLVAMDDAILPQLPHLLDQVLEVN
ncbi:MAG: hypothetical protein SFY81_14505 [Verrucomicrobiota bacterium]|nr:hypothetical protein [Verrucomicrobiota bacterium]